MKIPRITNAVGHIDDDLIASAEKERKSNHTSRLKWISLAACFAVTLTAGAAFLPSFFGKNAVKDTETPPKHISETVSPNTEKIIDAPSKYNRSVSGAESHIEWPWNYKTTREKYTDITFGGQKYITRSRSVGDDLLGDLLGTCEAEGVDSYTGKKYTETFEVRKINGVSEDHIVAAGKDGEFYIYLLSDCAEPETFGEFWDIYGLTKLLQLDRFSEYNDFTEGNCYRLNNDEYIRKILSECRDAKLYPDTDSFEKNNPDYLSFTVTSEALGIYKKTICISENGYFSTNIFDYGYVYFIGEDAAEKIIDYAKSNSHKAEFEPYESTISGTLTEIGNGYVLIDDAVLCADKANATVYRIPTDDLRIRRCIEYTDLKVGDIVIVKYDGSISDKAEIDGAYSIYKGYLVDGNVAVPE